MKRIKQKLIISQILAAFAILCSFSIYGHGQNPEIDAIRRREQEEYNKRQQERDLAQRRANLENLQTYSRATKTTFKRAVLSKKEKDSRKKFVAIDAADLDLSKDFLKQPHTGIFRIFPDNICFVNGVMEINGSCNNIFPGTWFYSFRAKDYSDDTFFDLFLQNGKLITDGFLSQGILVKLGNFSLDKVNLESKGAKFLVDFKPTEKAKDIKEQYEQIGQGIESDGYKYSREVVAEVGSVYLMRVVAYRLQGKFLNKTKNIQNETNIRFSMLEQDERVDMVVAFRIIRKATAGNLTIIWKELNKKKSPEAILAEK